MRVDSISTLRALTPSPGAFAELTGYYVPGDNGGGDFYWDSASSLADNNGTVIEPTSAPPTGRWIRVINEPVNVRWFGAKGDGSTDDTTAIGNAIAAVSNGEVIFGQEGTYIVSSSLTLSHSLTINLNNATIQFPSSVASTTFAAFIVNSNNVTIKNGTIKGTYNPATDTPTPGSGPYGVYNSGFSNMAIDRVIIENMQNYGILTVNAPTMIITNCQVISTGYISLFCDNTTAAMSGGLVDGNIFDRSALLYNKITQPCVAIRGSSTANYTTNLVFTNNKLLSSGGSTPATDATAACMELRNSVDSTISNNLFINGAIGLSIVGCTSCTAAANSCFNSVIALELGGGTYNVLDGNVADGNSITGCQGILVDGNGAYNTMSNNNITNVLTSCIEIYKSCNNNNIIGGTLEQAVAGKACIDIDGGQNTLISGVMMRGLTTGSVGVEMDDSDLSNLATGTVIDNCVFMDFASSAISIYAPNGGTITGIRIMNNTSNVTMLSTTLTGATLTTPYYYGNSPEIIGSKVILATGTNASVGVAPAMVAGTVTVSNTVVTTNSIIFLSVVTRGGAPGTLAYTKTAGTSFTISSSSATDTSTIAWLIVN